MPLTEIKIRKYTAILNQTGTNAPTATILHNTLGYNPTWTRMDVGIYRLTFGISEDYSKLFPICNARIALTNYSYSNDYIQLFTYEILDGSGAGFAAADGRLTSSPFELSIYLPNL